MNFLGCLGAVGSFRKFLSLAPSLNALVGYHNWYRTSCDIERRWTVLQWVHYLLDNFRSLPLKLSTRDTPRPTIRNAELLASDRWTTVIPLSSLHSQIRVPPSGMMTAIEE